MTISINRQDLIKVLVALDVVIQNSDPDDCKRYVEIHDDLKAQLNQKEKEAKRI